MEGLGRGFLLSGGEFEFKKQFRVGQIAPDIAGNIQVYTTPNNRLKISSSDDNLVFGCMDPKHLHASRYLFFNAQTGRELPTSVCCSHNSTPHPQVGAGAERTRELLHNRRFT